MKAVPPVLPGEKLGGKYRVERILGQGGMGVVVAARHIELDEQVAIKFLLGEPGPAALDRFLREARASVKIRGEHACRVLDFGRLESGEPYIVMEYLEGVDLAKKVDREGAQSPRAAVGWLIEACDAIADAHSLGIVHRDIKPANIFLAERRDGTTSAKVLDFGISKLPSQSQITGTQTAMGSPAYMSPEQMASAHDVDARTDIWSLGITLYELVAGKPPFVADSMVQLTILVREKDPAALNGEAAGLEPVIRRCLAKQPGDRYATIGELVAALTPFAPPEIEGLALRLARASSAQPKQDVALAATTPDVRRAAAVVDAASDDGPAGPGTTPLEDSRPGRARGTFAPLQSTLTGAIPATRSSTRSRLGALVAVGAIAGGIVVVMLARRPSAEPAASAATDEASAPTAPGSVAASARELPEPRTATPPPLTVASASSKPSEAPSSHPRGAAPRPPVVASAQRGSDAGLAVVPVASASTSATTPRPDPRRQRELDREDP